VVSHRGWEKMALWKTYHDGFSGRTGGDEVLDPD